MNIKKIKLRREDFNGEYLYININLEQSSQNIGMFTDVPYTPEKPNTRKLQLNDKFRRVDGATLGQYINKERYLVKYSGNTRVNELIPYSHNNKLTKDLVLHKTEITTYDGSIITSGDVVTNIIRDNNEFIEEVTYYIDATIQSDKFKDFDYGFKYSGDDSYDNNIEYYTQGFNFTNSSINPIIKEDYLMGVIGILKTKSNVFIDRGSVSPLKSILKLSEIKNLPQMIENNNFKIIE